MYTVPQGSTTVGTLSESVGGQLSESVGVCRSLSESVGVCRSCRRTTVGRALSDCRNRAQRAIRLRSPAPRTLGRGRLFSRSLARAPAGRGRRLRRRRWRWCCRSRRLCCCCPCCCPRCCGPAAAPAAAPVPPRSGGSGANSSLALSYASDIFCHASAVLRRASPHPARTACPGGADRGGLFCTFTFYFFRISAHDVLCVPSVSVSLPEIGEIHTSQPPYLLTHSSTHSS